MKKAVIFDLDGTLWDATGQASEIWNRVLARHPELKIRLTQDEISGYMGKTMEEIGAMLFPGLSNSAQEAVMEEFGEEVVYLREHGASLYDGVRENICLLMERNRVTRAVYVGDTQGDETSARFAGVPFIYAAYGFGKAVRPDGVLQKIRELPGVLQRIDF